VEPMPALFRQLQASVAMFGDDVQLFNCAITARNGRAEMSYPPGQETGQEASLYIRRAGDLRLPVDVLTLDTVLARTAVPQEFGLLLIDTEGGDLEVLQGLDFARHRPAVILTEDFEPKHAAKAQLLSTAGYDYRARVGADSIWTSRALTSGRMWPEQAPILVHSTDAAEFLAGEHPGIGHVWVEQISADFTLVRGWGHIGLHQPVPSEIAVLLGFANGTVQCFRGFRCPRGDVAAHFGSSVLQMSGFRVHLPPGLDRDAIVSRALVQRDDASNRIYIAALREQA